MAAGAFQAPLSVVFGGGRQPPHGRGDVAWFPNFFDVGSRDGHSGFAGTNSDDKLLDRDAKDAETKLGGDAEARDFHVVERDGHSFQRLAPDATIAFEADLPDLAVSRTLRANTAKNRSDADQLSHGAGGPGGVVTDEAG